MFTKDRAAKIKTEIKEHIIQNSSKFGLAETDGKLGIVGHSMIFKVMLTQPHFWEEIFFNEAHEFYWKMPPDSQSALLKNCEIYPLII